MSVPHSPTPDWAVSKVKALADNTDPEVLEVALELLSALCPSEEQDKFKYEAAWAAIDEGYHYLDDCRASARRYFSAA